MDEEVLASGLRLYPNPANGLYHLSSAHPLQSKTMVRISDLSGALIWEAPFNTSSGNEMEIDIRDRAAGVYLLEISNDEFRSTMQLVKE